MSDVFTSEDWDHVVTNGKNKLNIDQAILYNLVQVRKLVTIFVVLTAISLALSVAAGIVILINRN